METIRYYQPADAGQLVKVYNQLHPTRPLTSDALHQRLDEAVGDDGRISVMVMNGRPLAYALFSPVPGLAGMGHLEGFVALEQQRRGVGGRLLEHVCREARQRGLQQLSCPVDSPGSPAGCFLVKHGFGLEHEEAILRRSLLMDLPEVTTVPPGEIVTLLRKKAITCFCALYDQAFARLPWAQLYTEAEAAWLLQAADDLLFLRVDEELCGFAWLQLDNHHMDDQLVEKQIGVIEPIAVIASYRGRGYGRFLLSASLQELRKRDAQQAQIGTWTTNKVALGLYKSLGFEYHNSLYYLTLDL